MNLFLKLAQDEIALLSGTSLGLRIAAELNARRCQDDRQTTLFEIPVVCADSRANLSPSTRKIGDSAHSATKTHAGEVEVSQSYSAEPAPVSPDTVADQSAPDNHDTSGVGPCSPSADAAFFKDAPPEFVWTTERPTEPGHYWVEDRGGTKGIHKLGHRPDGRLVVLDPSFFIGWDLGAYCRFAGPIPKPVEKVTR